MEKWNREREGLRATQGPWGCPELPWPTVCGYSPKSEPTFSQHLALILHSLSCPHPAPAQFSLSLYVPRMDMAL